MTDLTRLQREGLGMLLAFDHVCRRHGIAYQLAAGTLLGAIRHGGFIPWDDDVDVCLRRAAYERFLAVAPAELAPAYRLRQARTEPGCPFPFCKMVSGEGETGSGAFLDIFPFDGVCPGPVRGRLHMRLAWLLATALAYRAGKAAPGDRSPTRARRWARQVLVWGMRGLAPQRLAGGLERVARWREGRANAHVACLVSGRMRYRQIRSARDFDACIAWSFEGHPFPVPRSYETVLENLYGDWRALPPAERRQPHHHRLT
ncbi:phosphorylcholine transferase LicD [Ancylobacter sp. IITR112]|uniref:LicD family protein n=1 Tax=Ancylobacter sp. IITR112 TaxID=3138073 RepID=UPI003529FC9B